MRSIHNLYIRLRHDLMQLHMKHCEQFQWLCMAWSGTMFTTLFADAIHNHIHTGQVNETEHTPSVAPIIKWSGKVSFMAKVISAKARLPSSIIHTVIYDSVTKLIDWICVDFFFVCSCIFVAGSMVGHIPRSFLTLTNKSWCDIRASHTLMASSIEFTRWHWTASVTIHLFIAMNK